MARVLIVYHTLSGNTEKMAQAFAEGAKSVQGTEVVIKKHLKRHWKTSWHAMRSLSDQLIISAILRERSRISSIAPIIHLRAKWPGNHMLRLLQAEEERRLLQYWIAYVAHSSLGKPLRRGLMSP